jgi:hypothetical protein
MRDLYSSCATSVPKRLPAMLIAFIISYLEGCEVVGVYWTNAGTVGAVFDRIGSYAGVKQK